MGRSVAARFLCVRHSQHLAGWFLYAEASLYQACFPETCPSEGQGPCLSLAVGTRAKAGE